MGRNISASRLKPYDAGAASDRKRVEEFIEERHEAERLRRQRLKDRAHLVSRATAAEGPISTREFHYTNPEDAALRQMIYRTGQELSLKHALAPRRDRSTGKVKNWWAKPLALALVAAGIGFVVVVSLNEVAILLQHMIAKF